MASARILRGMDRMRRLGAIYSNTSSQGGASMIGWEKWDDAQHGPQAPSSKLTLNIELL